MCNNGVSSFSALLVVVILHTFFSERAFSDSRSQTKDIEQSVHVLYELFLCLFMTENVSRKNTVFFRKPKYFREKWLQKVIGSIKVAIGVRAW